MKTIKVQVHIGSVRILKDKSISFGCRTPELEPNEILEVIKLQNANLEAMFQPMDMTPQEVLTIDADLNQKSSAQRLRSSLFVYWRQLGEKGEFDIFYRKVMSRFIDNIQDKLV